MPYREGLLWLGVAACAGGLSLLLLDFPMWGSMLRGPRAGQQAVQEEHYYLAVRHRGMGHVYYRAQGCEVGTVIHMARPGSRRCRRSTTTLR